MITPELADILACPVCKGPVEQDIPAQALVCRTCRLAFPVRNYGGKMLPVMLVEEALPLAQDSSSGTPAPSGDGGR